MVAIIGARKDEAPFGVYPGYCGWRTKSGFRLEGALVTFDEWDGRVRRFPGLVPSGIEFAEHPQTRPFFMFDVMDLADAPAMELVGFANQYGAFHPEVRPAPISEWRTALERYRQWMGAWDWERREGPAWKNPHSFPSAQSPPIPLPYQTTLTIHPESGVVGADAVGIVNVAYLLATAAIGSKQAYPFCGVCGNRFKYVHEGGRAIQEYCSKACNAKAYRQRKARAHELKASGMTPARIAKELGSTTETVKGWLKKK